MNPSIGLLTLSAGTSSTSGTILPGLIGIGSRPLKGGLRISGKICCVWSARRCRPERLHYKRTKYGSRDRQRCETKRARPSNILIPVAPPGATMSIGFNEEFDIQSLQRRLREMSEEKLLQFGRDAKYMCSPCANLGQPPREVFVIQLKEAKLDFFMARNCRVPPRLQPSILLQALQRIARGTRLERISSNFHDEHHCPSADLCRATSWLQAKRGYAAP
jgi:hypothetical protein